MRKTGIIMGLLIALQLMGFAQDDAYEQYQNENKRDKYQTLFGNNDISHGGYGGFTVAYSELNDKDAIHIGGRGGWIINHVFTIGIAGMGYFNDFTEIAANTQVNIAGGHGGLFFEPIFLPKFPVHISVPLFMGVGGIAFLEHYEYGNVIGDEYYGNTYESEVIDSDSYFIVEPGVELELNLVKFFRVSLYAAHPFTTSITLLDYSGRQQVSNDVLEDFKFGATFKIGIF